MNFLHTTSQSDLGIFALGLVIAGAVSGVAAGVLGVGGGIVIVPVLYHVMSALGIGAGVRMHVAIATSLAAMIPAALAHVQNAKHGVDWRGVWTRAIPVLIGVVAGCALAAFLNGNVLAVVFAVVATPVVLFLAPRKQEGNPSRNWGGAATRLFDAASGFASAMTGVAAETLRRCTFGTRESEADRSRATSSALALMVSVAAAIAFAIAGWNAPDLPPDSLGYVNLLGFALIAPVLLATEPAGVALAHMMDLRRLRLVFGGLVVIATARMLWDAFV